ncbi:MAG: hypothetical protein V2A62_01960 [Candidatus Woesearchaeota archaeon]
MTLLWLPETAAVTEGELVKLASQAEAMRSRTAPKGFVLREDPSAGKSGPFNLENALVQAVLCTLARGEGVHDLSSRHYSVLSDFIRDPRQALSSSSFEEKLRVVARLVESCNHRLLAGAYIKKEGAVFDPDSGNIVKYETSPYYYIKRKHAFEVLFNTQLPQTKVLFESIYGRREFNFLKQKHQEQNLFESGPLDLVVPLHQGWHIPLIGIKEVYYQESDVGTRLHSGGVEERIIPTEWKFREDYLCPKRKGEWVGGDSLPEFLTQFPHF